MLRWCSSVQLSVYIIRFVRLYLSLNVLGRSKYSRLIRDVLNGIRNIARIPICVKNFSATKLASGSVSNCSYSSYNLVQTDLYIVMKKWIPLYGAAVVNLQAMKEEI